MNGRLWFALLLLILAIVPVSIAVDLLVWPGSQTVSDLQDGPLCGAIWLGVIPVGAYCA